MPTADRSTPLLAALVDDDLRAIMNAVLDLAYYRRRPDAAAADLSRSVAAELQDRVGKLPDHARGE